MRPLIAEGHLFLAQPPLYKISGGGKSLYVKDDVSKDAALATVFKGKQVDISRFKGLGEMTAAQLKETTMNPKNRTLLRVDLNTAEVAADHVDRFVEDLMGRAADRRYNFIHENAKFVADLDI